jgi:hypothetical protein
MRLRCHRTNHQPEAASTELPKWWEVIDEDTEEGQIEAVVFEVLMRRIANPWASAEELAAAARLTLERVREVLARHAPTGLVARHPSRPDLWADGRAIARLAALRPQRSRGRGA